MRDPIGFIRQRSLNRQPTGFQGSRISSVFNTPKESLETGDPMTPIWQQGGWKQNLMGELPDLTQQQPPHPSERSRYFDEIERIRGEAGPGLTGYREALQNMPKEEDYKPSGWTRAAAGLSGFAEGLKDAGKGIAVAQGLNRSNYMSAMEEYSNRLGTLSEQANLEREDAKTRLDSLWKAQELGLKYDDYLLRRDETLNQNANRDKTANAAMLSAQARATTAAQKDYEYTPIQGGFMVSNRHDPSETPSFIRANTIQDAQLRVAQRNASVNEAQLPIQRQNANTATGNLMINQSREAREGELAPRRVAAQELTAGTVRAPEQESAFNLAQNQMANEAAWSRFFGTNWRGKPVGPDDFDPQDWQDFQDELADRQREILRSPRRP